MADAAGGGFLDRIRRGVERGLGRTNWGIEQGAAPTPVSQDKTPWFDRPLIADFTPRDAAITGAVGAGIGATAYFAKELLRRVFERRRLKPSSAPVAEVPVEVTPEEARELLSSGAHVKSATSAYNPDTLDLFGLKSFGNKAMIAALGTLALAGGWAGASSLTRANRKAEKERRISDLRRRIDALLAGSPEQGDVNVGHAMKIAEDRFNKTAFMGILGAGAGITGALALLAALRETADTAKSSAVASRLRAQLRDRLVTTPRAIMVPVLRDEEEPDPAKPETQPKAEEPKPKAETPKPRVETPRPEPKPVESVTPPATPKPVVSIQPRKEEPRPAVAALF